MARHPRLALPGYPHHVIQRGNNRQPIVLDEADRKMLYSLWLEESQRHKVAVNAYVLLDNRLHRGRVGYHVVALIEADASPVLYFAQTSGKAA